MRAVRGAVHFRDWRSIAELTARIYDDTDRAKEESVRRAVKTLAAEGYYIETAYRDMRTGTLRADHSIWKRAELVARGRPLR
jgi:hypothetical protein